MAYLVDQESWLSFFAERLEVDPSNLAERDIRLALALYHGTYLPTAAVIELRASEVDLKARYGEFGYNPGLSTFATATLKVTIPVAPNSASYVLNPPFIVKQGDITLIATSPLTIEVGSTTGTCDLRSQAQGALGTPEEAAADITTSVGWLRGATITITNVTPGRDGDDLASIQRAFRAYANNPSALVRADDHETYLEDNVPPVVRALATERYDVSYSGGTYTDNGATDGHLAVAVFKDGGLPPNATELTDIHTALVAKSVPYGDARLHVVPGALVTIDGAIDITLEDGADQDTTIQNVLDALDALLSWTDWPKGDHVHVGALWSTVLNANGVKRINSFTLNGQLLDTTPSTEVYELEVWEMPASSFVIGDITVS